MTTSMIDRLSRLSAVYAEMLALASQAASLAAEQDAEVEALEASLSDDDVCDLADDLNIDASEARFSGPEDLLGAVADAFSGLALAQRTARKLAGWRKSA